MLAWWVEFYKKAARFNWHCFCLKPPHLHLALNLSGWGVKVPLRVTVVGVRPKECGLGKQDCKGAIVLQAWVAVLSEIVGNCPKFNTCAWCRAVR